MEEIEIVVAGFEFTPVVTQRFGVGRLSLMLVAAQSKASTELCKRFFN